MKGILLWLSLYTALFITAISCHEISIVQCDEATLDMQEAANRYYDHQSSDNLINLKNAYRILVNHSDCQEEFISTIYEEFNDLSNANLGCIEANQRVQQAVINFFNDTNQDNCYALENAYTNLINASGCSESEKAWAQSELDALGDC